jgi:CARDB
MHAHMRGVVVLFVCLLLTAVAMASGPVTGTYKVLLIQVTYTDATTRADTLANLNLAGGEIHDYFNKLSFGALDVQVSVAQVTLTHAKGYYWTACPSHDDPGQMCLTGPLITDAAELAGAGGASFTNVKAVDILSPCGVYDPYDNFTGGGDAVLNSAHAHATVHQIYDTECPYVDSTEFPPLGPARVNWHGWVHEIGHTLQLEGHDMFSHPGGYSSGYDLMDSCYPCGETVYSLSGNPIVANEHDTSFPGWLPSSKTVVIPKPASGTAGGTYVLEPVNKADPGATVAPRGIKLPLDGDRSIFVEARTNTGADNRSYGLFDEGVHMYLAQESALDSNGNPKPLTMLDACQTTVSGGCIYDNSDPRIPSCPDNVAHLSESHPYCWPFNLWHPGDTFNDPINAIMMHVNGRVGDGYGVTVTRNVPPGHPDVFLYPWLTAPMNTYETIDIWVDSSCNGYESDVGVSGLRYGRRGDGTVVGNGDDPCANHENRIYAHIRNGGSVPAPSFTVHFRATDPLGVGMTGAWTDVGSVTVASLAAGGERDVFVTWTPHVTLTEVEIEAGHFNFHSCVQVTIDPPAGDLVTSNKMAQENFDNFEAVRDPVSHHYTVPDHFFFLGNNYSMIHANISGAAMKSDADFSKGIQLRIKSELPNDWAYEVNGGVTEFTLAPHEVRQIPVKIKVPPTTPTARTFNLRVTAFARHHMINRAVRPTSPNYWHFGWMQENGVVEGVHTVDPSKLTITAEYKCPDSRPAVAALPGTIRVQGHLDPVHDNTVVAIDYTSSGGGATVTHLVHTDAASNFEDALPTSSPGGWEVRALWQGDMDHSGSVSDVIKVMASPRDCNPAPSTPQTAPPNSTILVPDTGFQGGLLTGVVIGPDDQPVPNTPVEIAGGVPATLTGEVIGEPEPCPPNDPKCQPQQPPAGIAPGPPIDCAKVMMRKAGGDAAATAATQPNQPSANNLSGAPAATGAVGGPGLVTDAAGRFALCVLPNAPTLDVNLPGGAKVPVKTVEGQPSLPSVPPDTFQPGQKVSIIGVLRDPRATQGGRTWLLPAVHAWSPNGQQVISAFKTPNDLKPGPAQIAYTGADGQQHEIQGTVFKIVRAFLDRSQLHTDQGATFEYDVLFLAQPGQSLCVKMRVAGPVALVKEPPPVIPIDASGKGTFSGRIRAVGVTPGSRVPFDLNADIHVCKNGQ